MVHKGENRRTSDTMTQTGPWRALLALLCMAVATPVRAEVAELNVPLGAGGFGFLPLMMMRKHHLVEQQAAVAGLALTVNWANIGGPSAMNDALLSGSAHFISAGPPAFLTLWDRTRGRNAVIGAAAMSAMPMYLNTRTDRLRSVDDLGPGDKMAVTAVKVSIPSIIMQMHARRSFGPAETWRFDPFTVSMAHPDAVIALLSGGAITAHFASAPFHQREMQAPGMRTIMNSDDVMGGPTTFTMISTTRRFHDENPKAYAAFVGALKQAETMIAADPHDAAEVLLDSMGAAGGKAFTAEDMVAILRDPVTTYGPAPRNVLKYAHFMHEIGTLKSDPAGLDELFFSDPDVLKGD
jgi:NitT/TauT family transport system substrate-binding protein